MIVQLVHTVCQGTNVPEFEKSWVVPTDAGRRGVRRDMRGAGGARRGRERDYAPRPHRAHLRRRPRPHRHRALPAGAWCQPEGHDRHRCAAAKEMRTLQLARRFTLAATARAGHTAVGMGKGRLDDESQALLQGLEESFEVSTSNPARRPLPEDSRAGWSGNDQNCAN